MLFSVGEEHSKPSFRACSWRTPCLYALTLCENSVVLIESHLYGGLILQLASISVRTYLTRSSLIPSPSNRAEIQVPIAFESSSDNISSHFAFENSLNQVRTNPGPSGSSNVFRR